MFFHIIFEYFVYEYLKPKWGLYLYEVNDRVRNMFFKTIQHIVFMVFKTK